MKTTTTILIAIMLPSIALTQTIFSESFNSANSLNNWTLINADNANPVVGLFTQAWVKLADSSSADSSIASTSWYNPADTADDWLITPQIALTNGNILRWQAKANDPNFLDEYEVRISTTTPTVSAFLSNPPIYATAMSDPSWTQKTIDLANLGYANQNVYLAWRNTSYDRFILNIDNISIKTNPKFDVELLSVNNVDSFYIEKPQSQNPEAIFGGLIQNVGKNSISKLTLTYDLIDLNSSTSVHFDSIVSNQTLPSNGSINLFEPTPFPIATKGIYHIEYKVKIDSTDANLANNNKTSLIFRTDSALSRSTAVPQVVVGINGFKSEFASTYVLKNPDTLTTVTVIINNNNNRMNGRPISATIRQFNGQPTSLIAASDTIIFNSFGPAFVNFTFKNAGGYVPLSADTFVVGIVQYDSSLTLGATNDIFVPGTQWVNSALPLIGNQWTPSEQVGLSFVGMIYPNFGTPSILTSIVENPSISKTNVYPNPTIDFINIMILNEGNERVSYTLRDVTGKAVLNGIFEPTPLINEQIDLSSLPNGVYVFQTNFNNSMESIRVIKR